MSALPPTPAPDGVPTSEHGEPDRLIQGHRYDGIREYDNPMPRWWVVLFWVTIAWAPVYAVAVHFFDWLPTYGDDLAAETVSLEQTRAAYAAANPTFSTEPAALAAYVANADNAAAGAAVYATVCAACHGDKGQGTIGPNLADAYWLHGARPEEVFHTITAGVLDKGMPAWEAALSDEERGQLVAFIASLQGSSPAGAKEPQGEKVEG